jgi:hypothetical protein
LERDLSISRPVIFQFAAKAIWLFAIAVSQDRPSKFIYFDL